MSHKTNVLPPYAKNMRQVYLDAIRELGMPYPSIPVKDWKYFNEMTGGFRTREFSILCGSTGAGKTTWLANLSAQLLMTQVKHFVMSVETGHTDFMKRIMSAMYGEDLNTGDQVPAQKLATLTGRFKPFLDSGAIEFSLYENRVSVEQLLSDLNHMAGLGCKIAMIDNLNFFMEVTRASDAIVEMDRVIHELIIFCKQVDMHVIMVMHPKKNQADRSTRVKSEYDIKGSSTAVQEAHNVFLFNRPEPEDVTNGRNAFERELTLAKMRRRGRFVGKTIVYSSYGTQYQEKGFT